MTEQWRYCSDRDHEWAVELSRAWTDAKSDAVMSLDGGWSSARVLEAGFQVPRLPKWSLGFSDSSYFLLAQWSAGLPETIHGSTSGPAEQWQRTVALLKGLPVAPLDGRGLVQGIGEGPLVVTNLTVGTHLIGTPWMPPLEGAIVVFEDVGEAPYRVDRVDPIEKLRAVRQVGRGGLWSVQLDGIRDLAGLFQHGRGSRKPPGRRGSALGLELTNRPRPSQPGPAVG